MSSVKEAVAPSANAYVDAFRRLGELSDNQIQMLRLHYHAPERTVTARELALATGYTYHSVANALYGQLGRRIGETLNFKPTKEHVGSLVTFNKPDGKWRWLLRPQVAEALEKLAWVDTPHLLLPEEIAATTALKEGSIIRVAANVYERNPDARRACVESYGYDCVACGFNFGKFYGEIGKGFIHVHHLKPLSEIGGEYTVDPVKDLRPICPNCHAMLHKRIPAYSIEELQAVIRQMPAAEPLSGRRCQEDELMHRGGGGAVRKQKVNRHSQVRAADLISVAGHSRWAAPNTYRGSMFPVEQFVWETVASVVATP